jgi:hypothetical protein
MAEYLTPGSYIERVDASVPRIPGVRTDIAGFVGIARSGPLDTPVPVESFRQFVSHFGGYTGAGYLAYAVQAFFANGGRRCWVVRVASKDPLAGARAAGVQLADGGGTPVWRIAASSPGVWGEELSVRIREVFSPQAVGPAGQGSAQYTTVNSVTGFSRGSLVRLRQAGVELWRVVSHVDPHERRLFWRHPDAEQALRYDRALVGLDLGADIFVDALIYEVLVFRQARLLARFAGLTLVPEHTHYGPGVVAAPRYPLGIEAGQALPQAPLPIVIEALSDVDGIPAALSLPADGDLALRGSGDGLALLSVNDFVGEPVDVADSDAVKARKLRGIRALGQVDEVAVVSVPDILIRPDPEPAYEPVVPPPVNPCIDCPPPPAPTAAPFQPGLGTELPPVFSDEHIYRVQAALVDLCERRRDCFALLDVPFSAARDDAAGLGAAQAWRRRFDTYYAALYYPWLRVVEPRGTAPMRAVPACGHVAGQFALHDLETGVHKAAANRALRWLQDVTIELDHAEHGVLNPLGINAIRSDRGLRIMGARTLSSDPDWRYVNVRRLVMMMRKAIEIATQWAAFEPNDYRTRSRITLTLNSFLYALWQRGALRGDAAEQAFFVLCNEDNNPPEQRANGWLVAELGIAPSVPFEFVVLRVGRQGDSVEIAESGRLARAA